MVKPSILGIPAIDERFEELVLDLSVTGELRRVRGSLYGTYGIGGLVARPSERVYTLESNGCQRPAHQQYLGRGT